MFENWMIVDGFLLSEFNWTQLSNIKKNLIKASTNEYVKFNMFQFMDRTLKVSKSEGFCLNDEYKR